MTKYSSLAASLAAVVGMAIAGNALAVPQPTIGLDPTGGAGAGGWIFSDIWSDAAATGVDLGVGPPFVVGDVHTFVTQFVVASLTADGSIVSVPGLNGNNGAAGAFELTKTVRFDDVVFDFTPNAFGGGTVTFVDPVGGQTSTPNLTLYYDDLSDGGKAVSGSGAGTVSGFGNGTNILEATLVSNVSSFTAIIPGTGTGAFDLLFEITDYNGAYLNLDNLPVNNGTGGKLLSMRIAGNLTQPLQNLRPAVMWDGTPTAGGGRQVFSITAAETFAVPEPTTLLLMASSFGLIGAAARRRKA